MMEERDWRDMQAKVVALQERWVPVSEERITKMWKSVRETMDDFTQRLVQAELDRRGHSDTLAKLLSQHRQMEVVMAAQAVQLNGMQEQLNTLAVQLNDLLGAT